MTVYMPYICQLLVRIATLKVSTKRKHLLELIELDIDDMHHHNIDDI